MADEVKKVVLAYSGGLDTSVILKWLIETYKCEVIAFAADIGQEEELHRSQGKGAKNRRQQDLYRQFTGRIREGLCLSGSPGQCHL